MHHARKRFGQHFLKDHNILTKIIVSIGLKNTDRVVEIGPGLGALTKELLTQLNHLDVLELDRDLVLHLEKNFNPNQLTIYSVDALKFEFKTLSQKKHDLRIVGNLPYNISTPLLFKLFDSLDYIQDMFFMLQKEVVLRLTAKPGEDHYGRLSVMSQYFCNNEYVFTVSPNAFDPPPKVYSAIVKLTPKKNQLQANNLTVFSDIVREAFNYRRKKLSNALKKYITSQQLISLNINPESRPEMLTVDEFVKISLLL